jgi:hypothetical protein
LPVSETLRIVEIPVVISSPISKHPKLKIWGFWIELISKSIAISLVDLLFGTNLIIGIIIFWSAISKKSGAVAWSPMR